MDVTALLNRSAETKAEGEDARTPEPSATGGPWAGLPTPSPEQTPPRAGTRSRTPWDAGGYSLPLSLDTKFHHGNAAPAIYGGDSLDVARTHSAITPSSAHSRTTSLESSPVGALSSALVSPLTASRPFGPTSFGDPTSQLEISTSRRNSVDSDAEAQLTARRPSFLGRHSLVSPSGSPKYTRHQPTDSHSSLSSYAPSTQSECHSRMSSFSTVGMVHSGNSSCVGEIHSIEENAGGHEPIKWGASVFGGSRPISPGVGHTALPLRLATLNGEGVRPRSPSDAFLISRPARRPSQDRNHLLPQQPEINSPRARLNTLPSSIRARQTRSPIHKHKRAISAPNFFRHPHTHPHIVFNSQLDTLPEPPTQTFTRPRLVTMSSATSDTPEDPTQNNAMATHRQPDAGSLISCEKDAHCDMETPPRKMISQFFGRNKSCTKAIPRHVWLHFCRKHYQRERYQLGPDYPKLQSKLLLDQIARIQSWSDENAAKGLSSGVLRGWKLQLRKREEDRQSRNNAESDDEDGIAAVPQWLLDSSGDTYDTERILGMMERLRDEIEGGEVRGMPEVEILPDITTDQPKGPPKRRTSRALKTHRRAKSQGASRVGPSGLNPLPGFSNIPAVPPVGHPAAQPGVPMPVLGGPPSITTAPTLPELNPSRRPSLGAPRAEKRKAEETFEEPMTREYMRGARRVTVSHRPALQQVKEERDPQPPHGGHSRSRSDVSHRFNGGRQLPSFKEAFGPASDFVGARREAFSGVDARHDRRGSLPHPIRLGLMGTGTLDRHSDRAPKHISGLLEEVIASVQQRDPVGFEMARREGERRASAAGEEDWRMGPGQ